MSQIAPEIVVNEPNLWRLKTPGANWPRVRRSIVRGLVCGRYWVASTCSTSLVPMPNANAPKAPWVAVWLSPQTTVMPGCVRPCSGPITCTMPCLSLSKPKHWMPNSLQFVSSWAT